MISAWKFGGFPLFLASHSRLPASFKDVLEVMLLEALSHFHCRLSFFSVYCAAAPNLWSVRNPLPCRVTQRSARPEQKTDKEVNKQQPVAILAQGSRSACHDEHEGSLCFALPCFALLPCALTCHSLLCFAVRCSALLCCASLCLALLCLALRCLALPSFAFLCFALLCCSLLCIALLCVDLLCFALR